MHARTHGSLVLTIGALAVLLCEHGDRLHSAEPPKVAEKKTAVVVEAPDPPRMALDRKVKLDFDAVPLEEALATIAKQQGVAIRIDAKNLEDAAIDPKTAVTIHVADITLRSALNSLLDQLNLFVETDDQALRVATELRTQRQRVYDVSDIVLTRDAAGRPLGHDYDSLIELITCLVSPTTWDNDSIREFAGTIHVEQSEDVQDQITALLAALRRVKDLDGPEPLWSTNSESTLAITRKLQQRVSLHFDKTPLSEVAAFLRDKFAIPMALDRRSLADSSVELSLPITFAADGVRLDAALRQILSEHELSYYVANEQLWIGSNEKAERELLLRIYPVKDLTMPPGPLLPGSDEGGPDFDSLIELVCGTISSNSWDTAGGPGSIHEDRLNLSLVCSQTLAAHQEIERLLAELRQVRAHQKAAGNWIAVDPQELVTRTYALNRWKSYPAVTSATPSAADKDNGGKKAADAMSNPQSVLEPLSRQDCTEILEHVRLTVEPVSWQRPGAFLKLVAGNLVVRNTRAVQRQTRELLNQLDAHHDNDGGLRVGKNGGGNTGGGGGYF